jgi:hypothetical protein
MGAIAPISSSSLRSLVLQSTYACGGTLELDYLSLPPQRCIKALNLVEESSREREGET